MDVRMNSWFVMRLGLRFSKALVRLVHVRLPRSRLPRSRLPRSPVRVAGLWSLVRHFDGSCEQMMDYFRL